MTRKQIFIGLPILTVVALIIILPYFVKINRLEKLTAAMDIENPTTLEFSHALAAKFPGEYSIDQVCEIYAYLYKNWKYVSDPRGIDYFSKASFTIENNLTGDCDDFAILMATLIESIGGKTRINLAINSDTKTGHAFTEVYFQGNPEYLRERIDYHFQNIFQVLFNISSVKTIYYTPDGINGIWLNLDWSSKYPGGPYMNYIKRTIYYPMEGYFVSSN
jgi:Transglutaminase-like enzymes, putative cysteine proteases